MLFGNMVNKQVVSKGLPKRHNIRIQTRHATTLEGFTKEVEEDLSPSARQRQIIRNCPVTDAKYLDVWKRAAAKIRVNTILDKFNSEVQVFGQIVDDDPEMGEKLKQVKRTRAKKITHQDDIGYEEEIIPRCLIHPDGKIRYVWRPILAVLLLYTATVMPYRMAFIQSVMYDSWFYVELCVDALFFIDLLINCFSAYYNNHGHLVTDRKIIIISYLRSWFIIDLFSWIPFGLIDAADDGNTVSEQDSYNNWVRLLRLPRLWRLLRIARLLKAMKQNKCMPQKLQDFIRLKQSSLRLISLVITVMLSCHVTACIWLFTAKVDGYDPDSWVVAHDIHDDSKHMQYVTSLYWVYTTFSTVGYGDVSGHTPRERLLCIVLMVFGVWFFSYVIGALASIFNRMDSKEAILNQKMTFIDEFCKEAGLNIDLKQRLRSALQYSTDQSSFSWAEQSQLFQEIPKDLRYEVAMTLHSGAAKRIAFFKGRDPVFVCAIIPFLQHIFVSMDDFIYEENDYADEIYFIVQGQVGWVTGIENTVYKCMRPGSYFGEIEVLNQIPRKYNLQAAQDCSLLTMNRNLVYTISSDFPLIYEEMKDIAELRDKINQDTRKQCITELKKVQSQFTKILQPTAPPPPTCVKQVRTKDASSYKPQLSDVWKSIDLIEERIIQLTEIHQNETKEIESRVEQIEEKISYCGELTEKALQKNEKRSKPHNGHRLWPQTPNLTWTSPPTPTLNQTSTINPTPLSESSTLNQTPSLNQLINPDISEPWAESAQASHISVQASFDDHETEIMENQGANPSSRAETEANLYSQAVQQANLDYESYDYNDTDQIENQAEDVIQVWDSVENQHNMPD